MKLNLQAEKSKPQSQIEYSLLDANWQNGADSYKEITYYFEIKSQRM